MRFLILACLYFMGSPAVAGEAPCRTLENGALIDTASQLQELADVCTIKGNLGIYLEDGPSSLILPRLESITGNIIVESYPLEAFAAPALKQAGGTYFQGARLEMIELPALRYVERTFYAEGPKISGLNLMSLGKVDILHLSNVPSLGFIFLESLYHLSAAKVYGAPMLDPSVKTALAMAAGQDTIQAANESAEKLLEMRQKLHEMQQNLALSAFPPGPGLPPTGLDTTFGPNTYSHYFAVYPQHFYNYWGRLGFYNWTSYYGPGLYWWWH